MPSLAPTTDSMWFGNGYIYGTRTIDPGTSGQPASILLPSQFASIQEASVDFTIGTKELRGITEDPEDVANGMRKITGKVTTGRINLSQLNALAFGEKNGANYVTGSRALAVGEAHTIPSTPEPSVVVTNALTFFEDKGVKYAGTRNNLVPTTVNPPAAPGFYFYNPATGTYSFNAGDEGANILIDYVYTTTTGHTLTLDSLLMGSFQRPVFELLLQNPNQGDQELLLFACKATKITFPVKQEDYVKMEIDFVAFSDGLGRTAQWLSSF